MQGLRKQESNKFQKFFKIIQSEAKKVGSVFFADAGDGNDFETATLEGENMMGWLIPSEKVKEFEPLWKAAKVDDSWTDFFTWAIWSIDGDTVKVHFER